MGENISAEERMSGYLGEAQSYVRRLEKEKSDLSKRLANLEKRVKLLESMPRGETVPVYCGRSGCKKAAERPHCCPYQQEINDNNEFMCTCCAACRRECADDI